jgi:hypothetical protein
MRCWRTGNVGDILVANSLGLTGNGFRFSDRGGSDSLLRPKLELGPTITVVAAPFHDFGVLVRSGPLEQLLWHYVSTWLPIRAEGLTLTPSLTVGS